MKRCLDCGAPFKPGKACTVNHFPLIWSQASLTVMYRVAACKWEPPWDGLAAWEYVKPRGQDDDFFDIGRAVRFAKSVLKRKGVTKVEVRMEQSVQVFFSSMLIRRGGR